MASTKTTKTARKPATKKMASTATPSAGQDWNLSHLQKDFARGYNKQRSLGQNVAAFKRSMAATIKGFTIPT